MHTSQLSAHDQAPARRGPALRPDHPLADTPLLYVCSRKFEKVEGLPPFHNSPRREGRVAVCTQWIWNPQKSHKGGVLSNRCSS